MKYTSEEQYINAIAPAAHKMGQKYHYLPSVLIAQSCLENGYGLDPDTQSLIDYNNMLGIKAELLNASWNEYSVWPGQMFVKNTPEVYDGVEVRIDDAFRVYESIEQSFEDFCLFMTYGAYTKGGKPKYRDSVIGVSDPETVITNVNKLGYATDPNYAKMVMKIINKWDLTRYDAENEFAAIEPVALKEDELMSYQINKLISVAEGELGYLEKSYSAYKKNPAVIYEKTEGAGSDNVTKYGKDLMEWVPEAGDTYGLDYQWCDQFVDWCFIKAYGKEAAKKLLHGWSAYTPTSSDFFKKAGQWFTSDPQRGDVVFFRNSERICHTGIVTGYIDGMLYTIEGNTSGASGLISNGGGVKEKSYGLPTSYVAGFGRPSYGEQKDERDDYRKAIEADSKKTKTGSQMVFRLYNPNSGEHFYTAQRQEADKLIEAYWHYEGIGWYAPLKSGQSVYRLYNPNAGDHHYTMNYAERNMLVKLGWHDEGVAFLSDEKKATPIYRAYNPNAKSGAHNYTPNKAEQAHLISVGWRDEGIGWYGN